MSEAAASYLRRWGLLPRRVAVALVIALALAGCDSAPRRPAVSAPVASAPLGTPTPTPRPVPPTQTGWMHGVGVDVPASWPRNQLHCGHPAETTLVVEPTSAVFPLCFALPPKGAHPNVVWLGAYAPPLQPKALLGLVALPAGGLRAMTPMAIGGERAFAWRGRDPATTEPAVLVVLPSRDVFVVVMSAHRSTRDAVVASIHVVKNDPATGCAVRSSAYDAPPRHPVLDRPIDVSGAVSVVACHYLSGWLEAMAASMPPAALRRLARAIDAAPHVTSARSPIDAGCEGLDPGPPEYSDDGPVVLRFTYADGRTAVVVARVVNCTRWQSYLYAGNVERRMTGAFLLALPRVLDQFPGPETM